MEKTGLIDNLDNMLLNERVLYFQDSKSPTKTLYTDNQKNLKHALKEIGKEKDVGLILQAERNLIENEREFYGNSPAMQNSLDNALSELNGAETTYAMVHNAKSYHAVNETYQSHKSRYGDLPKDEARQFFKSQNARLLNMDKSRLDKTEKEVIEARRGNLRAGESAYILLQKQALGIELKSKSKSYEQELER